MWRTLSPARGRAHTVVGRHPAAVIGRRRLLRSAHAMQPEPCCESVPPAVTRALLAPGLGQGQSSRCPAYPQILHQTRPSCSPTSTRATRERRSALSLTSCSTGPSLSSTASMPPGRSVSCGWTPTRDGRPIKTLRRDRIARASPDQRPPGLLGPGALRDRRRTRLPRTARRRQADKAQQTAPVAPPQRMTFGSRTHLCRRGNRRGVLLVARNGASALLRVLLWLLLATPGPVLRRAAADGSDCPVSWLH